MQPRSKLFLFFAALLTIGLPAARLHAVAVTGWVKDTSFGGAGVITSGAATNSPILGNGSSNNADNVAIYAPFALTTLATGQRITLTGSAEFIGSASQGDFRWGLFKDDGVAPAYGGWLGYFGTGETIVYSKNPAGTNFATTTFASIASNRGVIIGQMTEPLAIPFDPGTYNFSMAVERFGNDVDVRVAISNSVTSFNIATPSYTESDPTRVTFSFDRVGFLAGSALDADQVRFSSIDVATSTIVAPTLQVRPDGMARIINTFSTTFGLTSYEITSSAGSLTTSWSGLGPGWFQAGGSDNQTIAEVSLSTASINNGESLFLGKVYTTGATQDLGFRFTTAAGEVMRGLVEYVSFTGPLPGDFDGDQDVDGADFVVWQTNYPKVSGGIVASGDADGDGDVDGADFVVWQTNFPTAPVPGTVAVPEPAAVVSALFAFMLPAFRTLTRRASEGEYV